MTWFDIISFWLILIWLVVLLRAKKKINTPIGVLIYGLILTLKRLVLFVYKSFVRAGRKTKQVVEENIIAAIQTHPYEVSLGKQSSGREFVVNVMDHHSLIGATSGGGKMQPLYSKVLTPFGFRTMSDIKVGSQVSNPDGGISKVIAEYPHYNKDVYELVFQDGSKVQAGLEHLWQYRIVNETWKQRIPKLDWKIATTGDLIKRFQLGKHIIVPVTKPIIFTRAFKTAIDPYLLGLLLGDGCLAKKSISISSDDEEILDYIREVCPNDLSEGIKYDYRINGKSRRYLLDELHKLGLENKKSNSKFVPEPYKYSSIEKRFAILQGLMDTDGYCDSRGHTSFTSVSIQLAEDVQWLVRSLGGRATITSKIPTYNKGTKLGQRAYTVYIRIENSERLFRLTRKKNLCTKYNGGVSEIGNRIVEINYIGKTDCKCIMVDNPNGLYITDDFVVTHNTYMLHHILKQLFDKGRLFFDNTDVYIIDLKGHPTDMLHLWKPLLSGYATRIGNNLDDALGLLQQIESRLGEEVERKILLIIDEAAILTADKKGDELLGNVASQLRLNGSLILLVQSPQYSVVKTFIRYNIPRRMCGLVMSRDQAKIILDYRPKQEELPERIGEYIIREPGKNKLIAVHTPKIELPEAINLTIKNVLGIRSEDLPEMKLLIDIVGPRTRGETITGVRAIASTLEIPNAQNFVMVAYRNFTNAGILDAPKYRGGRYTLAVADVNEAVTKLRDYLPEWRAAPESFIEVES